jgi:large repetitive protein
MRTLLVACAAAGSLLLGAGGVAASQGVAEAATTDQMVCDYTFAGGICEMGQAQAGQPYEGFLDTSGHDGGEFFVSGTVPPGTLVRPDGLAGNGTILGGTPTTAGTYTFTVSGTDDNGISIAPMTYQLIIVGNVQPAPLTINGSSVLPSGTVGTSYANVFSVGGGSIPYTWSVRSGQLPPGLALNSDITLSQAGDDLSGTPATAGTFIFTMQVTDGQGNQASRQFSLTIQPARHHGQQ